MYPFRPARTPPFNLLHDPVLAPTLARWRLGQQGRNIPAPSSVDPAALALQLPHLELVDVVARRFRWRLFGTALVDAFGQDCTGLWLDDVIAGDRAQDVLSVLAVVRDARHPLFLRTRYHTETGRELRCNRLCLPLSRDDRRVDIILSAISFSGHEPAPGTWGPARFDPAGSEVEMVNPNAQAG